LLIDARLSAATEQSLRESPPSGPGELRASLRGDPDTGTHAGTTSFLWDSGRQRFLFTGDSLWIDDDDWRVVVLESSDRAPQSGPRNSPGLCCYVGALRRNAAAVRVFEDGRWWAPIQRSGR
jgi:hypothetical protein